MAKYTTKKITVSIIEVHPNPWNPNVQSKEMFEKTKNSLKEMGTLGTILCRKVGIIYQILDGEHRWLGKKENGDTEISIEVIEQEVSDNDAKLLTILLNNIKGNDDVLKRAEILKELNKGQLSLLPFNEEEIKNELELLDFDFSQYDEEESVKPKDRTIALAVPEEVFQLWERVCVAGAEKHGKTPVQVFVSMCEEYSALRGGVKQRPPEEE